MNAKDQDFMKTFKKYYNTGLQYRGPVDVRLDEMKKSKLGCDLDRLDLICISICTLMKSLLKNMQNQLAFGSLGYMKLTKQSIRSKENDLRL